MNAVVDLAMKWKIKQAGGGGDLIDLNAFSKWGRQHKLEGEMEIGAARQITTVLGENFEEVAYIGGNHEVRFARATGFILDLMSVMRFWTSRENVVVSDYHWFQVDSGGGTWYVEHPRNTSIHATLVPKKLCLKYHCHVIAGHGHVWGITRSDCGQYWAIDSGICADVRRLDYCEKEHNTRPVMMQGAGILRDGQPILLCPENLGFWKKARL